MSGGSTQATWRRTSVISSLALLVVALIVLSPLAMAWMIDLPADWPQLAEIGQAYGGASAILSGLALSGVAASLLVQRRQTRITQLYSIRQRQFEIVKLALEDPAYFYVDGATARADPETKLKVYANLLVGHWAMVWDLSGMTEGSLRTNASLLFESKLARDWWKAWGRSYSGTRGRRQFVQILDEECKSRIEPPPRETFAHNTNSTDSLGRPTGPLLDKQFVVAFAVGVTIGVFLGGAMVNSFSPSDRPSFFDAERP